MFCHLLCLAVFCCDFTHAIQDYLAVIWLPKCNWYNPEKMKNITTTRRSTTKPCANCYAIYCIHFMGYALYILFDWIYCLYAILRNILYICYFMGYTFYTLFYWICFINAILWNILYICHLWYILYICYFMYIYTAYVLIYLMEYTLYMLFYGITCIYASYGTYCIYAILWHILPCYPIFFMHALP